jgi:hypothetical protein
MNTLVIVAVAAGIVAVVSVFLFFAHQIALKLAEEGARKHLKGFLKTKSFDADSVIYGEALERGLQELGYKEEQAKLFFKKLGPFIDTPVVYVLRDDETRKYLIDSLAELQANHRNHGS